MRKQLLVFGMALLMVGCGHDETISPLPQYDRATLEMKYQAAFAYVHDLSCAIPEDCDTMAIGAKPCGGARGYLVYSKVTVDVNELQDIVADVTKYEAGYNEQEGIISDCSVARIETELSCVDGKCIDNNPQPHPPGSFE
jgi:hypothetical protein